MRRRSTAVLLPALLALIGALLVAGFATGTSASASGASAGATTSPTAQRDQIAATRQVFVRPVTTEGRPAPGWTVRRQKGSVDCDGTSRSAVNPGIVNCYPTAYGFAACWKSRNHTVLCVRSARSSALTRIRFQGRYPSVTAPRTPAPIDLILGDRSDCGIRTGGAWGAPPQRPNWVGFYSCDSASVYGPGNSRDGINRSDDRWTAHVWQGPDGDIVVRGVRAAFYVGTAAAA